ncbi:MAG: GNAT family N-acetyltransferase [Paludibacteraceae bacterium]|nr:GNAT family N-acetyltransferase [Paludibacteraceae bacterium]
MTNKEEYQQICAHSTNIPIYSQHWWMEAVCTGKNWDVVIAHDPSGAVTATLPYLIGTKLTQRFILMPPLTQSNGICYHYPVQFSERERLEFEKKWANVVIARLKELKTDLFIQNFSPAVSNWLPFYWAGFHQTTRYTYIIEELKNLEKVFNSFSSAKQRQIRKAERNGLVVKENELTPSDFYSYHKKLVEQKGEKDEIGERVFLSLAKAAIARNQGAILSIEGEDGQTQSALFMVWDDNCAYYLVPANDRKYSTTGAPTLLVWEAIKKAAGHSKSFDFEGSMTESIENSYNQFGTKQTAYSEICKADSLVAKLWLKKQY